MEFRILGPLEVLDDGGPVKLGAPKQRAVLAVLLLNANQVVSADRLVDLVWGEDPPRTAAHSVQIYVSELRKAFAGNGQVIVTRRPGYELQIDAGTIDAHRFESLVGAARAAFREGDRELATSLADQALGLWRGPPLADFVYDEFAQREIQRLEELRERAVETICEAHVAAGRPLEAVPMLRDAIRRDPLSEEPRRLLMTALYAGGRQADALREFRNYRETLAEEVGLEPSPELLRVEEQILLRDPLLFEAFDEAPSRSVTQNPYKGLRAFDEADSGNFFGRDELVERLLEVCSSRLAALVGPSGSGKSSVVRAGLIPRLRGGAVTGSEHWTIITMLPGRTPFAEFDAATARATGGSCEPCDPSDDGAIGRSAVRCLTGETGVVLIVIDQFEELFTLTDEPTRRAFLRNLVAAVNDPRGRIRVLLTIRADFYDRPLMYPEFAGLFTENIVNVVPLTPAGIEAASVEPALRAGVGFAPNLLAEIVSDMADQPGALPLFQYVLTELFVERDGSTMTLDAYLRIGGLTGSLSRRADAVYESLEAVDRETARDVFVRLVKPTDDRYTRRPVPVLELESIAEADAVSNVLTRFGGERLLTFDRDSRTGAATVEVAHEALLSGWGRLAGWLEDAHVDIVELDGLMTSAAEWEAAGRDPGYLLAGVRLADYEAWNESTSLTLPPSVSGYLAASTQARIRAEEAEAERVRREERATHRARVRLWGMLAAVVAFIAVLTFAAATIVGSWGPAAVLLFQGPGDRGFNDRMVAGVVAAEDAFGLTVGRETSGPFGFAAAMRDLGEHHADLVLTGLASLTGGDELAVVAEYPETRWVIPDMALSAQRISGDYPNASFPTFATGEGSFLMGAAAALKTETGIVGFLGGMDQPVIWEFQAGFEAGVRAIDPEIVVLVDYLSPYWDDSGFKSPTAAFDRAREMHRSGADVIYTAAGTSGEGALVAAYQTSKQSGIQRWHIGVDVDEYVRYAGVDLAPEYTGFLPYSYPEIAEHVLTSMIKRTDKAFFDALDEYNRGVFTPGVKMYGLENDGVSYSKSGGFIDAFVPILDDLKERIIAGDITFEQFPEAKTWPPGPPASFTEW
jgi:basic membrane lipoprotein Med (substrate-binding protein (PBP1-ABC) superfamily)/DNA-binding SARP family transcriptional activator